MRRRARSTTTATRSGRGWRASNRPSTSRASRPWSAGRCTPSSCPTPCSPPTPPGVTPRTRPGSRPASSPSTRSGARRTCRRCRSASPSPEMHPSDRPVIAEPEERAPRRPFGVRLGEVMRLTGARSCEGCQAPFVVSGKGIARAQYCPACRARICPSCNHRAGKHYPYCTLVKPRACWGCGADLRALGISGARRYCPACRDRRCPECSRYAGQHKRSCLYEQRTRRPPLDTYLGIVTFADLEALYADYRRDGLRVARLIVGRPLNEDVVHDVMEYFLSKRVFLRMAPGRAYFLTAVRHCALRYRQRFIGTMIVPMDPSTLALVEQITQGGRTQRRPEDSVWVRLPESDDEA